MHMTRNQEMFILLLCFILLVTLIVTSCNTEESPQKENEGEGNRTVPELLVSGALLEVEKGVQYDASYVPIDYPGGDVPENQGACTDVVVRAFRIAGYDLQKLIHQDMTENFDGYPDRWGLDSPDPNIDHRRAPNQKVFMRRWKKTKELHNTQDDQSKWKPGDIVFWEFPDGRDHVGVVSNETTWLGEPLVIHNIGIAKEEDCLFDWKVTGHFRYIGSPSE